MTPGSAHRPRCRTARSATQNRTPTSGQRSTVVAQAIHHATEHRAQIAGALATNGIDTIDLDALDLWAFTEAEDGRA